MINPVIPSPGVRVPGETISPNGDLNMQHSDDPTIQALNNLRYWTDSWRRNHIGQDTDPVIVAAEHMITTLLNTERVAK